LINDIIQIRNLSARRTHIPLLSTTYSRLELAICCPESSCSPPICISQWAPFLICCLPSAVTRRFWPCPSITFRAVRAYVLWCNG